MKTIQHPLFIVLFSIHILYYILKFTDVQFPLIITNYLADLLSIFIVNTIALWLIRIIKKEPNLEFSPYLVFASVILFSFFFEYLFPTINPYYVSDKWDILCYLISGITFILWRKSYAVNLKH